MPLVVSFVLALVRFNGLIDSIQPCIFARLLKASQNIANEEYIEALTVNVVRIRHIH